MVQSSSLSCIVHVNPEIWTQMPGHMKNTMELHYIGLTRLTPLSFHIVVFLRVNEMQQIAEISK